MTTETLSEYERKRLETIRNNQKILASLNIPTLDILPLPAVKKLKTKPKQTPVSAKKHLTAVEEDNTPRRLSARIRNKTDGKIANGPFDSKRSARFFPEVEPPKPKRIHGTIPFQPEDGATDEYLSLIASTVSGKKSHVYRETAVPSAVSIRHQDCITKVVHERIYSIAVHPGKSTILACAGSKLGSIGFWDATLSFTDDINWMNPTDHPSPPTFLFKPHTGSVTNLRFDCANDHKLISSSYDGTIRCMDIVRGTFDELYSCPDDSEQLVCGLERHPRTGAWYFSDTNGVLSVLDVREARQPETFHLHEKKIGGLSICQSDPNYIASSSNDRTICIWDLRKMKPEDSKPITTLEYKNAVTAVHFHPSGIDQLISTCYDDHVRIHSGLISGQPVERAISHNNQTGRWITNFKAVWDPKSDERQSLILLGNMNRGLDLIDAKSGSVENCLSEYLTAQPAVNAAHPGLSLIFSGNASGKLILWSKAQ